METNENRTSGSADPKLVGILSYLTLFGWIIAMILNNDVKDEYASFHIRQSLGIQILFTLVWVLSGIPVVNFTAAPVGGLFTFVLWVLGFVSAVQGQRKLVPIIGDKFQEWFASL